jgi:prolipoprotein diacylglyceryltransferase
LRNALPYNGFLKRKNNSEWGKIPWSKLPKFFSFLSSVFSGHSFFRRIFVISSHHKTYTTISLYLAWISLKRIWIYYLDIKQMKKIHKL